MGAGASTALDSAGLSQYRSQFESLDKQELQQLDDAKLQEMGIGNAEQRQKLVAEQVFTDLDQTFRLGRFMLLEEGSVNPEMVLRMSTEQIADYIKSNCANLIAQKVHDSIQRRLGTEEAQKIKHEEKSLETDLDKRIGPNPGGEWKMEIVYATQEGLKNNGYLVSNTKWAQTYEAWAEATKHFRKNYQKVGWSEEGALLIQAMYDSFCANALGKAIKEASQSSLKKNEVQQSKAVSGLDILSDKLFAFSRRSQRSSRIPH